jgi:D-alanine-D-alanine ligase-like ATP-grasp enzyme
MTTEKKRLRIGVLFGGRSGEHEVSLISAASVISALDPEKYEAVPIGISKDGRSPGPRRTKCCRSSQKALKVNRRSARCCARAKV